MKRTWLISFNLITLLAWLFFLFNASIQGLEFDGWLLILLTVAQGLAIFEVIHSVVGWAGSNWFTTVIQVASRFFTVALLWWLPKSLLVDLGWYSGLMFISIAWGITEIVRAAYYIANLMSWSISALPWMRYNLFIVLYPIGLVGELMVMFTVMEHRQFNFDLIGWALAGAGLLYAIFFPRMYGHMFKQRKKKLA